MSHAYHITDAVSDIERGKQFYHGMFRLLGWTLKYEDSGALAYSDGRFDFWIVPAESKEPNRGGDGTGFTHLAFRVENRENVDEFHRWLQTQEAHVDIEPKAYPQYSENYYAVFFFDADGTRLEVVFL